MFRPRETYFAGDGGGDGGPQRGTAALVYGQMLPDLPAVSRWEQWRTWLADDQLTPDLAQDIGSARWFRGLGTMLALGAVALAFWPDFAPLQAAPAMHVDAAVRDEFRSQMILPLALGGDSGRHMGATAAVVPLKSAPERPRIELVATLAPGDSFGRMLQRAGVGAGDAARMVALVAGVVPLQDIAGGTKVNLALGHRPAAGQPRPLESLAFRARFDLDIAAQRRGGQLFVTARPIRVDATPLRIRGTVGASLYRSARAAGAPSAAVQHYLQVLDARMDLDSAIAPGDTFDLIVDYRRAANGEHQTGKLLYAGLERGGKPRAQLLRWGRDGGFFEASGVGEQQAGLLMPLNGPVTSPYGRRRHPILGFTRMHAGMDIRARYGTPIHAVTDGVVVFAGRHGGHGNYVRLNHGGGMATGYAHMSRFAVSAGSTVRRGQVIGYVGSTGLSTGPHLHYEMYRNGQTVNPASVRFATRSQLEGGELADFRARLAALKRVTPGAALNAIGAPGSPEEAPAREIERLVTRYDQR